MWLHLLFLTLLGVGAQYEPLISSSWSMWSPWSFCSNNVMIRVRACSTVRGYKCIGHNKEFQSCNSPPKRNNLDYEDPEATDREMAMKQLYQDYEPETPDEARFSDAQTQTRGNRNFHMISPTSPKPTSPPPTTPEHFSVMNRGGTGVGMSSEEFDYEETPRMAPLKPTNPSETTFEFAEYPKSTEEPATTTTTTTESTTTESTTTESTTTESTTTSTTTTTTTEAPTTTEEVTMELEPQTVTPKIIDHEAFVEPEDVAFRGKYTLEEPLPEVSQPTFAAPPGTMAMEESTTEEPTREDPLPSSFPIDVDPTDPVLEAEPVSDGSTHSVGSYSIGKEPTWEEEPIPLEEAHSKVEADTDAETELVMETEPPTRSIPRFSISPSTRKVGEVRRAPSSVNTHIEMPMSMLPFLPTTIHDTATITTTEEPEPTPPATRPPMPSHLPINFRPKVPKIALVTAEQNMQHFPKMMNEQRAMPRHRTLPSPSEYAESTTKKPSRVTVEISNKTLKKKRRNRRLKKLNRLGKIRTVAVLPTEFTVPATKPMVKPMPTPAKFEMEEEKFLAPKQSTPHPTWASEKDRKVFEENRELEARIAALRNKVEMNRKILATMKIPEGVQPSTTPAPVKKSDQVMLEGDTARALSWMINDMERMVDDKARTDVVDQLPVEKVDDEPGFKLGETDDATTTTMSPFPFPIPEDGFALIRSKRSIKEEKSKKRILWSSWSEWTDCQCGKQSRKRKCLKQLGGPKYPYDDHTFIPIHQDTNGIEFAEPAEFPDGVTEPAPIQNSAEFGNRVKRSLKCAPPQIEVRSCVSYRC